MKAAVYRRYGGPDVVSVIDVPKPRATGNELLVKVVATTVNRTDCGYRAARPFFMRLLTGLTNPRRTVLGTEFAGKVEATGPDVSSFAVGDRVFGYLEGPFGAHAEYLTVREDASVATIPPNVSFDEAAASFEGAHYALANIRGARIHRGQHILVHGGTGAIGSAAIQLLKTHGADVTATADTSHLDLVKGLGADRVLDYTTAPFTNDDRCYDVVFDAVGKSSFRQCKHLLKSKGTYLSTDLGPFPQNPILALVTPLLGGRRVLFPIPKHDQAMVTYIGGLLASGDLRPVIDRCYPLDEIVDAYQYVETGQKIGNVVIHVAGEIDPQHLKEATKVVERSDTRRAL